MPGKRGRTVGLMLLASLSMSGARAADGDSLCRAGALGFSVEPRAGDGDQFAQLVLRNRSTAPCRLPAFPLVGFSDGAGHPVRAVRRPPVRAVRRPPPGLHPGPVVMPVTLRPGAAAAATLRWISSPAQGRSGGCQDATAVIVVLSDGVLRDGLATTLCPAKEPRLWFDQTAFHSEGRPETG